MGLRGRPALRAPRPPARPRRPQPAPRSGTPQPPRDRRGRGLGAGARPSGRRGPGRRAGAQAAPRRQAAGERAAAGGVDSAGRRLVTRPGGWGSRPQRQLLARAPASASPRSSKPAGRGAQVRPGEGRRRGGGAALSPPAEIAPHVPPHAASGRVHSASRPAPRPQTHGAQNIKPGRSPTPSCWRTGSLLRAQGCLLGEAALGVSAPRPGAKGGQGQPRVAPCLRPSRHGQRPCRCAWSRPCCVVKPRLLARQAEIPAHAHLRPAIGEALLGFVP